MRLRSWRGTTVVTPTPRRAFPWVRVIIVLLIVGIAAYLILPNLLYIRADAVVKGDLIPVTPVYRVRLEKMLVNCTGSVRAGQPVAMVSNFLLQADYQRQYLESQQQSQLAGIALDQNVATARENAESLHQKYIAATIDSQRLQQEFASYDRAYREGAVPRVTWEAKKTELQGSQAVVSGALSDWKRAESFVSQVATAQQSRVSSAQAMQQQSQAVANRVGSETLRAPVGGDIVDCVDRPQNVIEAGTSLFDIFPHNKAYVVAYFNPDTVAKVHIGDRADVSITGLSRSVEGRVSWIYPNLEALPAELTRFFWQHEQFQQFRPVKIELSGLPARERDQLYYNAQARVSINKSEQKS